MLWFISAPRENHLTSQPITYSHANTPLGQSERAYYLSYFTNLHIKYNKQQELTVTLDLLTKRFKDSGYVLFIYLNNFIFSLYFYVPITTTHASKERETPQCLWYEKWVMKFSSPKNCRKQIYTTSTHRVSFIFFPRNYTHTLYNIRLCCSGKCNIKSITNR